MNAFIDERKTASNLEFVWLELTNRCNLQCIHCYAESSPHSGKNDILTEQNYLDLIRQIHDLGCSNVQFIGGEPTLNRSLPRLIEETSYYKFDFVEVFTNLINLPEDLLQTFVKFNIAVATSFYSYNEKIHDAITTRQGSFKHTVANIKRVLKAGLRLRAGIIVMSQNENQLEETWHFLENLGIKHIGTDHIRNVGRANESGVCNMDELCGSCSENILSIGPDGLVAPCNMSKNWSVGSVLLSNLDEIVVSEKLLNVRQQIKDHVRIQGAPHAICNPKTCPPYPSCCPSTQICNPCAPNGCSPCYPKG